MSSRTAREILTGVFFGWQSHARGDRSLSFADGSERELDRTLDGGPGLACPVIDNAWYAMAIDPGVLTS